ncbi:MAG: hypothetical protein ACYDC0_11615 [Acidimicrobiales bacterium]
MADRHATPEPGGRSARVPSEAAEQRSIDLNPGRGHRTSLRRRAANRELMTRLNPARDVP